MCLRCHLEATPKAVTGKARKCHHCLRYVDSSNCKYVKTTDRYFCNDEHRKEFNACERKKQKKQKPTPDICTGSLESSLLTQAESGFTNTLATTLALTTLPQPSSAAKFDRDKADRALAKEGLRLDESVWPEMVADGVWKVATVGYMGCQPVGPRILEASKDGWKVDKQVKKETYTSNDPLGGM